MAILRGLSSEQERLDAALDALVQVRKQRDHWRKRAQFYADNYYQLLRITGHEPPLEEPLDDPA